jgi:quercetin dioxygenase-like cupin family protein
MKVIDLKGSHAYPLEEREKNVFFQSEDFSARIVALPSGGGIPPCEMAASVIFVVISGTVTIRVNGKDSDLVEGYCLITEPATLSMKTEDGARLLGIQIPRR